MLAVRWHPASTKSSKPKHGTELPGEDCSCPLQYETVPFPLVQSHSHTELLSATLALLPLIAHHYTSTTFRCMDFH